MAGNILENDKIQKLREQGIITESEVVYQEGDIIYAENVLTQERRVLNTVVNENSTKKRLLKG